MDAFSLVLLFIFFVIPALACAQILTRKGSSYCFGFLFGLLLSYVGLIIALILPPRTITLLIPPLNNQSDHNDFQLCPFCGESIPRQATECPFCHELV